MILQGAEFNLLIYVYILSTKEHWETDLIFCITFLKMLLVIVILHLFSHLSCLIQTYFGSSKLVEIIVKEGSQWCRQEKYYALKPRCKGWNKINDINSVHDISSQRFWRQVGIQSIRQNKVIVNIGDRVYYKRSRRWILMSGSQQPWWAFKVSMAMKLDFYVKLGHCLWMPTIKLTWPNILQSLAY